jgi:hypothetical protein
MYADQYVTDVSTAEESRLLGDLRQQKGELPETEYSVLVVGSDHPAAKLARALECKVFSEFSFDEPITKIMREEYTPYDDHSFFLISINWKIPKAVGVMRIVKARPGREGLNGLRELKSLYDIENPHEPWAIDLKTVVANSGLTNMTPGTTWDVATLAVHPDYRRKSNANAAISFSLYHELYILSKLNDVEYWVAILDEIVLALIQKLGRPFHHYHGVETKFYVGAPSTPVYCHIKTAVRRLRWKNYLLYRQLAKGHMLRRNTHFEEASGL